MRRASRRRGRASSRCRWCRWRGCPPSVSSHRRPPPGTATGFEFGTGPSWTHSRRRRFTARLVGAEQRRGDAAPAARPRPRSGRRAGDGSPAARSRATVSKAAADRLPSFRPSWRRTVHRGNARRRCARPRSLPERLTLHGRAVSYARWWRRPACCCLIHGMAGTCRELAPGDRAARPAPHGDRPRLPGPRPVRAAGGGDYSLGSLASGLRDLLLALGHERATLVGHSLGGGVAMQFAYQFPEMVERLVLVSSGGLGPDVSPILRAAALPGADLFIAATAAAGQPGRRALVGRGLGGDRHAARPRTSPRWPAATRRLPIRGGAGPSWRPCARWSAPRASASPPSTASTSPRSCPC